MKSSNDTSEPHASSGKNVWGPSAIAGVAVFSIAAFFQWLVYDDWLHDHGPLRVIGSLVAGLITFAFVFQWRLYLQRRELDRLHHAKALRHAQDLVRNSLQTIECVTYANDPLTTDPVRDAVDIIEKTLEQALAGMTPYVPPQIIEEAEKRQARGSRDQFNL